MPTITEVTRARELLTAAIEKAFPGTPYTSSHDPQRGLVFTLILPRSTASNAVSLSVKLPGWAFYDTTPRDGESLAYIADHPSIDPAVKLALAIVPLGEKVHAPGKKLAPPLDFPICWVAFFEDVRRAYNTCEIFAYYEPGGWVIEVLGTTRDDLLHRDRGLQGYKFEPVPGELHTFRTNANQRHFLRLRFAHTGESRRPLPPPPPPPPATVWDRLTSDDEIG